MRPSTILATIAAVVWCWAGVLTIKDSSPGPTPPFLLFSLAAAITVTVLWAAHQLYMAMSARADETLIIPPAWTEEFATRAQTAALHARAMVGTVYQSQPDLVPSRVAVLERAPVLTATALDDPGYWIAYGHIAEDILLGLDQDRDHRAPGADSVQ